MKFLDALGMVLLAAGFAFSTMLYIEEKQQDIRRVNFKQRDYQLDIYDTTITLYRGNGLYYVGEASVNKLDSLIMEDNK